MEPQKKKDTALVKKAMRGDPKAFSRLIQDNKELCYRMAYAYTRNEEDALDCVQESILKAYQGMKKLHNPEIFSSWLVRIVINTALDICRNRKPQASLEDLNLPAPEELLAEEHVDLRDAIHALPEKYRDVVMLKYFDGYTIREISCRTGMPEGTVSVYLSRALKLLKQELKEEIPC